LNGCEDAIFTAPSAADMEGAAGTKPYSLFAFINHVTDTDAFGGVLQNIDPGTEAKWRNKVHAYKDSVTSTSAANHLFSAMDEMFLDVKFTPPPSHQEYFENPALNAMFIACSKAGQAQYVRMLRSSQDTFVTSSRQDPAFMKPQYAGIDLEYVSELDTAAVYGDSHGVGAAEGTGPAGTNTESTTSASNHYSGARYYFINANYLKFVYHTSRYMHSHPTMRHPNQPFTTVKPVDSWYNFICRSRQRQGIIVPNAV
jgi:hypothetical protein